MTLKARILKTVLSEELSRRKKDREEWARMQATMYGTTVAEFHQSGKKERGEKRTECSRKDFGARTESDRMKQRLKDRQEWAKKQEDQHQKQMQSIMGSHQPNSKCQHELTMLVDEMADALNDVVPGFRSPSLHR